MMRPVLRLMCHTSVALCLIAAGDRPAAAQSRPAAPPPDATFPQSNLEVLLARPDALLVKDLYRVGDNATAALGLTVDAIIITPRLPSGAPLRGVRIVVAGGGRSPVSYVDVEEAAALSQALAAMADVASTWSVREGARAVEAQFMTVDGFVVGFHQDGQNQHAFVRAGFTDPVEQTFTVSYLSTVKTGHRSGTRRSAIAVGRSSGRCLTRRSGLRRSRRLTHVNVLPFVERIGGIQHDPVVGREPLQHFK